MSYDLPQYLDDIKVVKVWDSIGNCIKIDQYVPNPTADEAGTYYFDNKSKVIYIYPRHGYGGSFYQYSIGYEISSSPNVKSLQSTVIAQDPYIPYRFVSSGVTIQSDPAYDWKISFTENPTMKFILPENSEVVSEASGQPSIGKEQNRPTAEYHLDYPTNVNYTDVRFVTYDIVPLRTYFIVATVSIACFIVLISGAYWFARHPYNVSREKGKEVNIILTLVTTLFVATNIPTFLGLGGYNVTYVFIFTLTIALWLLFIIFSLFGRILFRKKPYEEIEELY